MKREVHRCDCLQILVYTFIVKYYELEVLILISVVSTFCWDLHRAILIISCIILLYILCHKLVFLVLVRLIAINIYNRTAALIFSDII